MGIPAEKLVRGITGIAKGFLGGEAPPPAGSLFHLDPRDSLLRHQNPSETGTNNSSGLVAMFEHLADADHEGHPLHAIAQAMQASHWSKPEPELREDLGEGASRHVDSLIKGKILERIEHHGVLFVQVSGTPPSRSSSVSPRNFSSAA